MKANKFLTFLSVFTLAIIITSCVEDDDYNIPEQNQGTSISIPENSLTTFKAIYSRLEQANADGDPTAIIEEDLYITGYVVSSDQAGNFYEEILIQNKIDDSDPIEDPRLGLRLAINVRSLSDTYNFGRKVYIKLNGLTVGNVNGILTIAKGEGSDVEQLQEYEYANIVLRDSEVANITPKIINSISELTSSDLNTYLQLENMQFNRNDLSLTYAGELSDEFDGFRILENCDDNSSILLQTSTFADFKSIQIAQQKGSIKGTLSRDFGDDFDVFVINNVSDVSFDNADRCDPIELDCGPETTQGTMNLFTDDFESQSTNSLISGNGWTNYIQAGSEAWEAYSSGGTNSSLGISARIGAYNSGDSSNVGWLITPAINFDAQENETLVFKTSNSFSDNSNLELLFSTDWDGTEANIVSATWGVLPAAYIVQDSDFYGSWFDSGVVDLSCAEGMVHIAFKYTGGDVNDFTGTYELDEISLDYTP